MGKDNFLDSFLLIGKIVGTHGLNGTVKVLSYAESPSVFKSNEKIVVKSKKGSGEKYDVNWVKLHKRIILLSLKGVISCNMAKTLIGSELLIERSSLPKLEEGTYYWSDIIGLSVFTTGKVFLGHVESIIATGSNDVFVVKDAAKKSGKKNDNEILIPALESVVEEIDIEHKRMRVNLPDGL